MFALCFAFGLSLLAGTDVTITTDKQLYFSTEAPVIDYKAPAGSYIYVYLDAATLPLRCYGDLAGETEGQLVLPASLPMEPGIFKVQAENPAGVPLDSMKFGVREVALVKSGFKVALMTDIHVMAPELLKQKGKAFDDAMAGDRKMLDLSADIFSSIVDSLIQLRPHLLLIAGDLTKDGERLSHELVAAELTRLRKAGVRSLVIPGHHDVKNPYAVCFDGDNTTPADDVLEDDFRTIYQNFGYNKEVNLQDTSSLSYIAEPITGLCVIGIDATRSRENLSKRHGDASDKRQDYGRLRAETLQWVLDRADEAGREGKQVVALMHHQLLQHFEGQEQFLASAAIDDGDNIAQLFMQHGIRLVMTGHMHISNNTLCFNSLHTDSLLEVSTGATVSYPSHYRMLTFGVGLNTLTVQTRNLRRLGKTPDMLLYGRDELAARMPRLTKSLARTFSTEIDEKLKEVQDQLSDDGLNGTLKTTIERIEATIPDDPDARAELMYTCFGDAFRTIYLTACEGNENRKLTDSITQLMLDGIDGWKGYVLANGDFCTYMFETCITTALYSSVAGTLFEVLKLMMRGENIAPMLTQLGVSADKMAGMQRAVDNLRNMQYSLTQDVSYYGMDQENQTNDLFLTFQMPVPQRVPTALPDGAAVIRHDDILYDLLGRPVKGTPASGIYIRNGQKLLIP